MSNVKITIIGVGAIGTSLGLALKQTDDPPRLIAHDKDPLHTRQALKMGAFDKSEWNLINAVDNADLIVLALPADAVRPTLEAIAADLKPDAVLTDTLSTKADILQMATELLPPHRPFCRWTPDCAARRQRTGARQRGFVQKCAVLSHPRAECRAGSGAVGG